MNFAGVKLLEEQRVRGNLTLSQSFDVGRQRQSQRVKVDLQAVLAGTGAVHFHSRMVSQCPVNAGLLSNRPSWPIILRSLMGWCSNLEHNRAGPERLSAPASSWLAVPRLSFAIRYTGQGDKAFPVQQPVSYTTSIASVGNNYRPRSYLSAKGSQSRLGSDRN